MNKTPLFILTFVVLTLVACTSKYTIKGTAKLHQLSGKTIYLKCIDANSNLITLDSAQIIHGEFLLVGNAKSSPEMVTLFMDDIPMTPLILESGTINISFSPNELMIHGTPLNNSLYSFYQKNQFLDQYFFEENKENIELLNEKRMQFIQDFMKYNRDSSLDAAIYAIYSDTYPDIFSTQENILNDQSTISVSSKHIESYNSSYSDTYSGYFLW